jgi:hypothetical protein
MAPKNKICIEGRRRVGNALVSHSGSNLGQEVSVSYSVPLGKYQASTSNCVTTVSCHGLCNLLSSNNSTRATLYGVR